MINQNCGKDSENPRETAFSQQGVFRATQVVLTTITPRPPAVTPEKVRPGFGAHALAPAFARVFEDKNYAALGSAGPFQAPANYNLQDARQHSPRARRIRQV
jgi:hypothetical protein